jgi:3-phytase
MTRLLTRGAFCAGALTAAALWACESAPVPRGASLADVAPAFETEPVGTPGDAADDVAIRVDPNDPARTLILATDKQGFLLAYTMDGREAFRTRGRVNNVDVLTGVRLSKGERDLAIASDRDGNRLVVYEIGARGFIPAHARDIVVEGGSVYGLCAMRSDTSGEAYVFVTTTSDDVQQWRLSVEGDRIDAALVRRFSVGGHAEGMVVDTAQNALFLAEEDVGIWRYVAEPGWLLTGRAKGHEEMSASESGARTLIAQVGRDALAADVEGLAIYPTEGGGGYLLAASQGDSTFAVFERRAPHAYLGSFRVVESNGIDGVSATDGIDATHVAIGERFPLGILVVQDDANDGANQNFKVIDWREVEAALVGMSSR